MKKEIISAIEHKQTDQVPYNIELTSSFAQKLMKEMNCTDVDKFLGNQMLRVKYKLNRPADHEYEYDIYGVKWQRSKDGGDVGNIVGYPMSLDSFDGYTFPSVCTEAIEKGLAALAEDTRDRFRMFGVTMSFFERSWSLRSMENILVDMCINPEFTFELYDKIEQHIYGVLDLILDKDFEALYIGDDYGQQRGLIMGPPLWRKFIKPGMSRIIARAKSAGKYVVLHSCGDCREILPDFIEMGVDVYNTVQPEIYDLQWLKREYGADLTFYGGISTQQFLPFASKEETAKETDRVLSIMASGGGYILSPTHAVTDDIPVANVLELISRADRRGERR